MQEISLIPDTIFSIFGMSINSAVLGSYVVLAFLIYIALSTYKKLALIPGNLQIAGEAAVSIFYTKLLETYENKDLAKKHTALIISFFLFILISNQFSLIPLIQSITVNGTLSFKTPTAHLSQTITLALITVGFSHYISLKISPLKHIGNYIKLKAILDIRSPKDIGMAFLEVFLGLLDIIGEIAKVISLSCRLFGNIFAGEVMIAVIAGMSVYTSYLLPVPFYAISIFSGIIQALVFAYLATSFISAMAISSGANLVNKENQS